MAGCQSFLEGRYALEFGRPGRPVPEWAWINLLAHAPVLLLRYQASLLADCSDRTPPGHRAISQLAAELLATARRTGYSVERCQRAVLIDLELTVNDPAQHLDDVVGAVREALRQLDDAESR